MKSLIQTIGWMGRRSHESMKSLLVLGVIALGFLPAQAQTTTSPRGRDTFSGVGIATTPTRTASVGGPRPLMLTWNYPASLQTPDLIFKVYHSTNIVLPLKNWPVLTNVPGTARSVTVQNNRPFELFVVTASNRLGESSYATP